MKDHCNLDVLNAATLVENARKRFAQDKMYTYISQLLIAINPFKEIKDLYSEQMKEVYKGANWSQLDPHVYAIAEMSYQSMLVHNQSQSLLVSGESGAGKTETNKQLMDYLIWRAGSAGTTSQKAALPLDRRILDTNPVLEAFGNAKSIRNNNSSRFGKYINLKFNKDWQVMGAEVRTFLLEKSRVTNASLERERSYHIFYQLLKGSQTAEQGCKALFEKGPSDFSYTSMSGTGWVETIDDQSDFTAMDRALPSCGLSETERAELYNVLGSLLYLGNVKMAAASDDTISVTEDTLPCLRTAEQLLGISPTDQLLIEKVVKSPRSNNVYHIALDLGAAQSQRDALVKHLYHMLFNLLIEKINSQIQVDKDFHRFIGLLDVFGFEVFQTNSFEQLCINYANERLHNFFLMRVFEVEMELYRMQNLQVPPLTYPDNSKVIELLEKTPNGIFPLLDAQCKMPKGSDKNFNLAICKQHANHAHFSTLSQSKLKMHGVSDDDVFVIHHFAGDVCYNSAHFLEKNTDSLSAQFGGLLVKSTCGLVVQMVIGLKPSDAKSDKGDMSARSKNRNSMREAGHMSHRAGGATRRGPGGQSQQKAGSVSKLFLLGLKQLMREIATTHPYFIRCIKPNQSLMPGEFHTAMVLSQMEKSGTIECVKLMQQGYPSRAPYSDLMGRFRNALPDFMMDLEPHRFVRLLLLACNCGPEDYQLGLPDSSGLVFFRSNKGGLLQELMMMRKDLVSKKIVENGKKAGLYDEPELAKAFEELDEFVKMRTKKRQEARKLFEDAIMAAMHMSKWVKWGEAKSGQRCAAAEQLQAIRRGRAARLKVQQMRKAAEEKRAAEAAARKAAEEAAAAAKAAEAAEAEHAAEMQRQAVEAQAAADKAKAEAVAATEAIHAAEREAAEKEREAVAQKADAWADANALAEEEDEDEVDKWFVKIDKHHTVHRYLMCKGVEWGFQYHNFYGDWELSSNEPLCNNRPHYVHNTMYGGHAHLFHTIDPHYNVPRWVIGPAPGNENGWAFCESDAPTPHEVQATWISWDGFEWHSCKSFRYVPKEHEMDGLSDEEDFLEDDDWEDDNQLGSSDLASLMADKESSDATKNELTKVVMSQEAYEEMRTNRQMQREDNGNAPTAPASPEVVKEEDTAPLAEPSQATEEDMPDEGNSERNKKDKGKKGKKEGKKERGLFGSKCAGTLRTLRRPA